MDNRKKTLFSFFALVAAAITFGCGYPQPSRFQMSFLPSPPVATAADIPAPKISTNPYLTNVPPSLRAEPKAPRPRAAGDLLLDQAEKTFQQGKRLYQFGDVPSARREFDSAIDLMLEASAKDLSDRQEFQDLLDGMIDQIHRLDLTGMGASAAIETDKFEKAPLEDILQMTFPVDPKLKDRVREQAATITSQLPLAVNNAVLGYINYFANHGHKTVVAGIQRSGRYRPMIQRVLQEEGIPQELIHLAQAESGFMPRAVSRKAAGGMWQFLVSRGQEYGLHQTRFTDDRMDPEMATRAAAKHLHDLYTEFGDWYLAMAAYNCGPGAVERAVERTGYADFWELRNRGALPVETTNYVPIVLALTIMEKNAAEYGLQDVSIDPALDYDTVNVTAPTSLTLVSDITETPLGELAAMNPALLKGIAPKDYPMHAPKGTGKQLTATLERVPVEHRDSWRLHRLGPGETLASIAKSYGVSANAIAAANHVSSPEQAEDGRLLIPSSARVDVAPRPGSHTAAVQGKAGSKTAPSVRRPVGRTTTTSALQRKGAVVVARMSAR
jgi:membrane-bound lytic murein transglycosylase D